MPEQSEGNNYTEKNAFSVLQTIFFLLGRQKMDLFTLYTEKLLISIFTIVFFNLVKNVSL